MNAPTVARAVVLALVVSAIVVVQSASPAHACRCAGFERAVGSGTFEAAFVGMVVAAPGAGRPINLWTFRVDRLYRGELPPLVDVVDTGGECGFPNLSIGTRFGVLLVRFEDAWISGGCSLGSSATLESWANREQAVAQAPEAPPSDRDGVPAGALAIWGGMFVLVAVAGAFAATRRRGGAT